MMSSVNEKTYLMLSKNILDFLDIKNDELDEDALFPAFKKTKNEIIERVLSYIYVNKLIYDDGYIKIDNKLKSLVLNKQVHKITESELIKSLDRHAVYITM